jgi:hypothetical protein
MVPTITGPIRWQAWVKPSFQTAQFAAVPSPGRRFSFVWPVLEGLGRTSTSGGFGPGCHSGVDVKPRVGARNRVCPNGLIRPFACLIRRGKDAVGFLRNR